MPDSPGDAQRHPPRLFDRVRLLSDGHPVPSGSVGYIVDEHREPPGFELEISGEQDETIALFAVAPHEVAVLPG